MRSGCTCITVLSSDRRNENDVFYIAKFSKSATSEPNSNNDNKLNKILCKRLWLSRNVKSARQDEGTHTILQGNERKSV